MRPFCARTPHYVLPKSLSAAHWSHTKILRGVDAVAAFKNQPGKGI